MKSRILLSAVLIPAALFLISCSESLDENVASPVFKLKLGTFYEIEMSSSTEGASIAYTTDGTDPKDSESAVEGSSAEIDYLTVIKAYAYKDGMVSSDTVEYRVPSAGRSIKLSYAPDYSIKSYTFSIVDENGAPAANISVTGPGADSLWLTEDDLKGACSVNVYQNGTISETRHFSAPGSDGEWLSSDDILSGRTAYTRDESGNVIEKTVYSADDSIETVTSTTYSEGKPASVIVRQGASDGEIVSNSSYSFTSSDEYRISNLDPEDGVTILGYTDYFMSGGLTQRVEEKDAPGEIQSAELYSYENTLRHVEYTYSGDYVGGALNQPSGFAGYLYYGESLPEMSAVVTSTGTAAEYEVTTAAYSPSGDEVSSSTEGFRLINGTLYTVSKTTADESWSFEFNDSGLPVKKTVMSNASEAVDSSSQSLLAEESVFEYDSLGRRISEEAWTYTYNNTAKIDFSLSVSAGYVDGGHYSSGGYSFSHEGAAISQLPEEAEGRRQLLKSFIDKLGYIYKNISISSSGTEIPGEESGRVLITARVSEDNQVKVFYCFDSYSDGDISVNGTITASISGKIDLTGNLSGSLDGSISGSLKISGSSIELDSDSYQSSRIIYTYEGESLQPASESHYSAPGNDGVWGTSDDSVTKTVTFTYDVETGLKTRSVTDEEGTVTSAFFTYDADSRLISRTETAKFGVMTRKFDGSGEDSNWLTAEDNSLVEAFFEFSESE